MKRTLFLVLAVLAAGLMGGCDSETHPDPKLVESMNAQRQAQAPGNTQTPPPTGR